jgi:hypothetical protein
MRFDAAVGLKEEILLSLPEITGVRGGMPPPIGIGIAPSTTEGQYRLAVRPRYETDLTETAISILRRRSVGELDVRVTGPIVPTGRCLTVGASTAHRRGRTGTLGFFARRNRDGALGFVSANHVIAAQDGVEGDEIIHAVAPVGDAGDCVGLLDGDYPRLKAPGLRTVDCAFARLVDGVQIETSSIGAGESLMSKHIAPFEDMEVSKVGRTTGRTFGRVTALALDNFALNYSFGEVRFKNQIEIESSNDAPFSGPGDSGSALFSADRHPIGLIYARSAAGGVSNSGLTFANPISVVLEALGVTLVA